MQADGKEAMQEPSLYLITHGAKHKLQIEHGSEDWAIFN